jgi:hypothetical protein
MYFLNRIQPDLAADAEVCFPKTTSGTPAGSAERAATLLSASSWRRWRCDEERLVAPRPAGNDRPANILDPMRSGKTRRFLVTLQAAFRHAGEQ